VPHVVGADEAGPAGHEVAHDGSSWSVGKQLKTTENLVSAPSYSQRVCPVDLRRRTACLGIAIRMCHWQQLRYAHAPYDLSIHA
jgi:hypothetical protein